MDIKFYLKNETEHEELTEYELIICEGKRIEKQRNTGHVTQLTRTNYDKSFDDETVAKFAISDVNAHLELGWTITRIEL